MFVVVAVFFDMVLNVSVVVVNMHCQLRMVLRIMNILYLKLNTGLHSV